MSLLRPSSVAVIAFPVACLFGACSARHDLVGTSGAGGAAGGTSESGPSSTGVGGGDAADAAPLDASADCPGDAGAWQQLTATPSPCETGTECCVIMSPCLSQAQIVGAPQQAEASSVWPHCDLACVDCIPPAIDVACVAGMCLGRLVADAPPDSPLRKDHCGNDVQTLDFSGKTGVHFGCGG